MATPAERGIMTPPMNQQSMPPQARAYRVHGQVAYVDERDPTARLYRNDPSHAAYRSGYPYAAAYGYGYPDTAPYGYPYANPYGYANDYANPFSIVTSPFAALTALAAPVTQGAAPLVTGRSVATGEMGKMCSTPVKSCELYQASWIGNGCSCKVTGGRSRGSVTP